MKNKFTLPLFAIALVIAFFWLYYGGEKPKLAAPKTSVPTSDEITQQNVAASQTQVITNDATFSKSESKPTTEAEASAKVREMLEARNHPVEAWGKVVDQNDTPLSGVKVEAEIGHFVWPPEQYPNGKSTEEDVTTDASGQFHIYDNSAEGIYVILRKEGYEQESPKGNGYALGAGDGTKENPIVLRMWSTNVLQKLITGEKHFHVRPDGHPYFVNLTDGAVSESGTRDLKIWIKYPEQTEEGKLYDWSCEIDVMNGGLLEETNGDPMYIAPAEGYAPSFHLEQQIKGGQSGSIGNRRFYLTLKNGQEYGRVQIDLIAPYDRRIPGLVRLSYAINPSGSRILR